MKPEDSFLVPVSAQNLTQPPALQVASGFLSLKVGEQLDRLTCENWRPGGTISFQAGSQLGGENTTPSKTVWRARSSVGDLSLLSC